MFGEVRTFRCDFARWIGSGDIWPFIILSLRHQMLCKIPLRHCLVKTLRQCTTLFMHSLLI